MNPSLKPYLTQLRMLYFAIFAGMVILSVAAWLVRGQMVEIPENMDLTWMVYAAPLSGIAFILLAHRVFRSRLQAIASEEKLHVRIEEWRSASIMRMLILDAAVVVNLIALVVTSNGLFLALAGVIALLYFLYVPNLDRLANDLKLEGAEREVIFDPNPPGRETK